MKYLALFTLPAAAFLGACGSDSPAEQQAESVEQATEQRADALEKRADALDEQADALEEVGEARADVITGEEAERAIPRSVDD